MSDIGEYISSTSRILPQDMKLYRYDLECPPVTWSTEYKSREYQYNEYAEKNKVGAFFFYDNIADCERTAMNAIKNRPEAPLWYTECHLTENVKILDLRQSHILNMLEALYSEGIDVLKNNFVNDIDSRSFSEIKDAYVNFKKYDDSIAQLPYARSIVGFWGPSNEAGGRYDYFGQQLTDFDNGFVFKQLLEEKGFAGYCFYEGGRSEKGDQATTYCLFKAESLSNPKHTRSNL